MSIDGLCNDGLYITSNGSLSDGRGGVYPLNKISTVTPTIGTGLEDAGSSVYTIGESPYRWVIANLCYKVPANTELPTKIVSGLPTPSLSYNYATVTNNPNVLIYDSATKSSLRARISGPISRPITDRQWDKWTNYEVGDWVLFNYVPYKCISDSPAGGVFSSNNWQEAQGYDSSAEYVSGDWIKMSTDIMYHKMNNDNASGQSFWVSNEGQLGYHYAAGEYITSKGSIYKCLETDLSFTGVDNSKWQLSINEGYLTLDGSTRATQTSDGYIVAGLYYLSR